ALVFSTTKRGANMIAKDLVEAGIEAEAIHGNKSQNARQRALNNFKEGNIRVLVATDIAARGIDVNELSHVFNYNLPDVPETYVHRIGRTGRAGAKGVAISFCDIEETKSLKAIEKLIHKEIPVVEEHPYKIRHINEDEVKEENTNNNSNKKPSSKRQGGNWRYSNNRRKNNSTKQIKK
ncbi:helicase-related protein, partial [Escherichia coli]